MEKTNSIVDDNIVNLSKKVGKFQDKAYAANKKFLKSLIAKQMDFPRVLELSRELQAAQNNVKELENMLAYASHFTSEFKAIPEPVVIPEPEVVEECTDGACELPEMSQEENDRLETEAHNAD